MNTSSPGVGAFDQLRLAEEAAGQLDVSEVPRFAGELERVKLALLIRASAAASARIQPAALQDVNARGKEDRILNAREVGERLGRSRWWVYDHAEELPRVLLPGGKFGFSERQLGNWIERRQGAGLDPRQEFLRNRTRNARRVRERTGAGKPIGGRPVVT